MKAEISVSVTPFSLMELGMQVDSNFAQTKQVVFDSRSSGLNLQLVRFSTSRFVRSCRTTVCKRVWIISLCCIVSVLLGLTSPPALVPRKTTAWASSSGRMSFKALSRLILLSTSFSSTVSSPCSSCCFFRASCWELLSSVWMDSTCNQISRPIFLTFRSIVSSGASACRAIAREISSEKSTIRMMVMVMMLIFRAASTCTCVEKSNITSTAPFCILTLRSACNGPLDSQSTWVSLRKK
mmetsp:Transcript_11505/g.27589  ORF Transcript_11505/g.27589 Transcript_11505/m.27589 type:complete len:239 (-) Transcript_11505:1552-2268(-)